jgi:hypothetical protein
MEFSEMQEMIEEAQSDEGGVALPSAMETEQVGSSNAAEESPEEWATVKEPVTPDTLVETALALLGSLSSLATIAAPTASSFLANITEIAQPVVTQKLPSYIALLPTSVAAEEVKASPFLLVSASSSTFHATQSTAPVNPQANAKAEADLAVAVFTIAIAGAEYESRLSEPMQYLQRIIEAFKPMAYIANASNPYAESSHVPAYSAMADAYMEFAETVVRLDPTEQNIGHAFQALGTAQARLTEATNRLSNDPHLANYPGTPSKASLYLTRGNVELLRRRLSQHPSAAKGMFATALTLLKNAGVYYRGAVALAKQSGEVEVEKTATFRNLVVKGWEEGGVKEDAVAVRAMFTAEDVGRLVEEMIEDGLIGEEEG